MLIVATFIAGCGTKQTQDTKTKAPQVGIIDMEKAIQGHPKYNEFLELEKQAQEIGNQIKTEQFEITSQAEFPQFHPEEANKTMDELGKASEQEFNAKMTAKQVELSPRLNQKAEEIHLSLSQELEAYKAQVDKEYQSPIFNLELKLSTLQLTKEEGAALQGELESLRSKRYTAINEKSEQLAARMNELMADEKAAVDKELAAYAQGLNEELSKQVGVRQSEIVARMDQQKILAKPEQPFNEKEEQLVMKRQEIEALQGFIVENIREKAAKVAIDNEYEVILTHVAVNITAVDITSMVIAECNK